MRLPIFAIACFISWSADAQIAVMPAPKQMAINFCRNELHNRIPAPIEGLWQLPSGAILATHRLDDSSFELKLFNSPDLSAQQGIVVGTLRPGAKPGMYDASLARSIDRGVPSKRTVSVAITISDDLSWIEFTHYRKGISVDIRRFIPYLFRLSIRSSDTRPDGLNGARRIYPLPVLNPDTPLEL